MEARTRCQNTQPSYFDVGFGCGHGTGMVFGVGRLMSGFGVCGKLSGMSTGLGIVVTYSS
jgi:hypothetical protein